MVDGLEREMHDKLRFAKVDTGTDVGAHLAAMFHLEGVPAFVVLDENGAMIYRQVGGTPDAAIIRAKLAE